MLHRMCLAIAQKRPCILWNFHLHMDNALAHTALLTKLFIHTHNISVMPHPPYSPDLAPNDFFYPTLKFPLRGQHFQSLDELEDTVDCEIRCIPSYKYEDCILRVWPHHWDRCIERDREYFEGLH